MFTVVQIELGLVLAKNVPDARSCNSSAQHRRTNRKLPEKTTDGWTLAMN